MKRYILASGFTVAILLTFGCGEENQTTVKPKISNQEKIAEFKRKLAEQKCKNDGKIPLETVLNRKVSDTEKKQIAANKKVSGGEKTAEIFGDYLSKRDEDLKNVAPRDLKEKAASVAVKKTSEARKSVSVSKPEVSAGIAAKAKALRSRPPTDLIAWYKLDGDFKDSSGNGLDLTPAAPDQPFSKAPAVLKGENKCFGPVGSSSKRYGAVGPELPLNNRTGFTICGFVAKPTDNNYQAKIFGCGSGKYREHAALFYSPYGVLYSKVGSTTKKMYKRLDDGLWHHHAIVVPPESRGERKYTVYIDGKKAYDAPLQYLSGYGPFVLGEVSGSQGAGFRIDEVKVFNRSLSIPEIEHEARLTGSVKQVAKSGGGPPRIKPEKYDFPIKGQLEVRFFSPKILCVVGNYNDFVRDRFKKECGEFLLPMDTGQKFVKKWSYNFYYRYCALDVIADYRPRIQKNYQNPDYFSFTDTTSGEKLKLKSNGYWINAVGQMRVPIIATGKLKMIEAAAVAHFAFIELDKPLEPGKKYVLTTPNKEKVTFEWDDRKSISQAFKVNQVGYMPDAGRKYGYIGGWLATLGSFDPGGMNTRRFSVIDEKTGKAVLNGPVLYRSREKYHYLHGRKMPLYGENIWDMDFSKLTAPGKYHLYVPGIGRSETFELSKDAVGKAFYTHIRGLYHQRSGIAKKPPYTQWVMGADHKESWKGGFVPTESEYSQKRSSPYGFRNQNGNSVTLKHFTMVRETATDKKLPNVWGGWWDAGDYDRRQQHFRIVEDLLSAYLMYPKKFSDGQQHIPESGNGIPDIVDEVLWCMEMWRKAQSPNGGIGCWIEADSHPTEWNPAKDKQRYYLAASTVQSSLRYSIHAGLTAIALRKCGKKELADKYIQSAEKAFVFAISPNNAYSVSWEHYDNKAKRKVLWSYREDPNLPKDLLFRAALHLFILTNNQGYYRYLKPKAFGYTLMRSSYPSTPFSLTALAVTKDVFPEYRTRLRREVLDRASTWMSYQDQSAYRTLWYPAGHKYFLNMSWGNVMPFTKGRYLAAAYYFTGRKQFRDALLLANDWMLGTNPMGRSFTTGLGRNRPIRVLSLASYSDGILQPLPGITQYTFTSRIAYRAKTMVYALKYNKRPSHHFKGLNMCLLPKTLTGGKKSLSYDEMSSIMDRFRPIWRRYSNIEQYSVEQNEFTVWETIGPCAAVTACLLPDNWQPPEAWKHEKPKEKLSEMAGYLFQP